MIYIYSQVKRYSSIKIKHLSLLFTTHSQVFPSRDGEYPINEWETSSSDQHHIILYCCCYITLYPMLLVISKITIFTKCHHSDSYQNPSFLGEIRLIAQLTSGLLTSIEYPFSFIFGFNIYQGNPNTVYQFHLHIHNLHIHLISILYAFYIHFVSMYPPVVKHGYGKSPNEMEVALESGSPYCGWLRNPALVTIGNTIQHLK